MPEVGIQNTAAKRIPRLKHRSSREKKKRREEKRREEKRIQEGRQKLRRTTGKTDHSSFLPASLEPPVTDSVVTIDALRLHVRHERLQRLFRAH
jgi:hypothetical protein